MGAISSEIVHLLKVKLPLKMTRDGFFCFLGFQNFPGGGGTPVPPYQIKKPAIYTKYMIYFVNQTLLTQKAL